MATSSKPAVTEGKRGKYCWFVLVCVSFLSCDFCWLGGRMSVGPCMYVAQKSGCMHTRLETPSVRCMCASNEATLLRGFVWVGSFLVFAEVYHSMRFDIVLLLYQGIWVLVRHLPQKNETLSATVSGAGARVKTCFQSRFMFQPNGVKLPSNQWHSCGHNFSANNTIQPRSYVCS